MLPLINVNERIDLCISVDPAIVEPETGREPCRAIPKRDCKISTDGPLVLTVRPLRSREFVRVMDSSSVSLTEAALRAAESGLVAITGPGLSICEPKEVLDAVDRLPHYAVVAIGSYLIEQSAAPPDPKEPAA